ncbi:MAG: AraC family transcriptional regulator [Bacteroidetes bacterium]|nr:AraC family transcriptional regulator [Bacteroidota bacterium]
MKSNKPIPTFDIYKTLDKHVPFSFVKLEEGYSPYDASAAHRHNYFEILFFNGSGGFHEIDFTIYPIEKNALHFISPEQVHLLRRKKSVTGFVVSFNLEFCIGQSAGLEFINSFPFFNQIDSVPIVRLQDPEQLRQVSDLFVKISQEFNNDAEDKGTALFSYLSILLIQAKRNFKHINTEGKLISAPSELTRKFKSLAEQNFRSIKTVHEYADLLNISAGHLNDTVKKESGKTASELIHQLVLLEAKRLLYHSPKSVKEIAFELNYENTSHFNKFFKTHTQQTPLQFRELIREKYH